MIEIKNLSKTFISKDVKTEALDKVSLNIEDGDIYGIIGMSGAGKSTLVRCINMLEKPDEGEVIIDGQNLNELSEKELRKFRRKVAMIFQGFNLLMQVNCLKNVMFPLELAKVDKEKAKKRALELLELVGLKDKAYSYPSLLSGGQQQRVAIARSLAYEPEVIYFDEPTSALDPELIGEVLNVMKELAQSGITMVVVTHEMSFAKNVSDRILFVEEGKIIENKDSKSFFESSDNERVKRFIKTVSERV